MKKLVLIIALLFVYSGNTNAEEYNLNAYFRGNLQYENIDFPDNSKYLVLEFSGNWEDSLGNYGDIRCLSSQFTNSNAKLSLEAFCQAKNQKKVEFWIRLKRESYEFAGIGNSKYLFANAQFKSLINKECKYAVQLVEGGGIFKKKCKLTKDEFLKLKSQK